MRKAVEAREIRMQKELEWRLAEPSRISEMPASPAPDQWNSFNGKSGIICQSIAEREIIQQKMSISASDWTQAFRLGPY
jgi:hypothetical protein